MLESLETRTLLTALPVLPDGMLVEQPAYTPPPRVVTLEEFLAMDHWNDDEIVVEWYSNDSTSSDADAPAGDDEEGWSFELEEDVKNEDEDLWLDIDLSEGGPGEEGEDEELLSAVDDDDDTVLEDEGTLLDEPMEYSADAGDPKGSASLFNTKTITQDDLLDKQDQDLLQ